MSRKISIEASNLKKIYKKREVVNDVSSMTSASM